MLKSNFVPETGIRYIKGKFANNITDPPPLKCVLSSSTRSFVLVNTPRAIPIRGVNFSGKFTEAKGSIPFVFASKQPATFTGEGICSILIVINSTTHFSSTEVCTEYLDRIQD